VPGIRQLISIPAGLAKMPLLPFVIFTTLGATIWNTVLAVLGYLAHGQADLINKYSSELSYILLGLGVLFIIYLVYSNFIKKKKASNQTLNNED
jgi:membrane protein DedA with SNARE-associated domain